MILFLFGAALAVYFTLVVSRRFSFVLWPVFSVFSLAGLAVSTINLFELHQHFTTVTRFVETATINGPAYINFVNFVLLLPILLVWQYQESSRWRQTWPRMLGMQIFLFSAPEVALPVMISHLAVLDGEKNNRKYHRMMHIFALIAVASIALVLPHWREVAKDFDHLSGQFMNFYQPATINWASIVIMRTMVVMYPVIVAWCMYSTSIAFFPAFAIYGFFSLPSLLALVLILRELRINSSVPKKTD